MWLDVGDPDTWITISFVGGSPVKTRIVRAAYVVSVLAAFAVAAGAGHKWGG